MVPCSNDPIVQRAIQARMWRAIIIIALLDVLLFMLYASTQAQDNFFDPPPAIDVPEITWAEVNAPEGFDATCFGQISEAGLFYEAGYISGHGQVVVCIPNEYRSDN